MKFGSQKKNESSINLSSKNELSSKLGNISVKNNTKKHVSKPSQEIITKYRRAGEISRQSKKLALSITKPGVKILDICEKIENFIIKEGGKPAFPVNVSINEIAAHYSASLLDTSTIPKNSVVKVDLGVHIDGYIVDTAITIHFSKKYDELVNASKEALNAVIEHFKPGISLGEIGEIAEKTIEDYGFKPIKNLFGHQIKRYNLHAGLSIPSTKDRSWYDPKKKIEAGRIYAIEPFATTGQHGMIDDGKDVTIYRFVNPPKGTGSIMSRAKNYYRTVGTLPFSPRWLKNSIPNKKEKEKTIMKDLTILRNRGIVFGYHTLVDVDLGIISQHEHTVRTTRHGVEVLT